MKYFIILRQSIIKIYSDIKNKIDELEKNDDINGIEYLFASILLRLRIFFPSYWINTLLQSQEKSTKKLKNTLIEFYSIAQLSLLFILFFIPFGKIINTIIVGYILFEIYFNLFNIVFIGKIKNLSEPPASIERSILLLMVNVAHVVIAFSIFYRDWLSLSKLDAMFSSILVFATIKYPISSISNYYYIVMIQIVLDIVLIIFILGSFIGQINLFKNADK